jgi:hypothetical protein
MSTKVQRSTLIHDIGRRSHTGRYEPPLPVGTLTTRAEHARRLSCNPVKQPLILLALRRSAPGAARIKILDFLRSSAEEPRQDSLSRIDQTGDFEARSTSKIVPITIGLDFRCWHPAVADTLKGVSKHSRYSKLKKGLP